MKVTFDFRSAEQQELLFRALRDAQAMYITRLTEGTVGIYTGSSDDAKVAAEDLSMTNDLLDQFVNQTIFAKVHEND